MDSLERLQGLHADLQAFAETRLANIDRLWQELEDSVQEFKRLLDKPKPSAAEREAYNAGALGYTHDGLPSTDFQ
jgi:nuclear pore complex protein Nup205